jgi:4-amino-4-deoxy-L-arabinose transferase-like glycosyltransferase
LTAPDALQTSVFRRSAVDRWFMPLLVTLAIGIRVAVIASVTGLSVPPEPGSDDAEYDSYAWNVAQGRGYRGPSVGVSDPDHLTAYRPPVPSLYYAAVYTVFGHSYAAARIANAVVGGLTVLLVGWIGRRCFDVRIGRLAAVVFALAPTGMYFGLGIVSEALSAFLVVLVVWCSLGVLGRNGLLWAVATGLSFGLLLLSKPGFLFVLPLLPFWAWAICGRRLDAWVRIAAIPVTMGVVLLPWVIRNLLVMGALIPFGTGGGQLLLSTSNRIVVGDPELYGYSAMDHYLPEYRAALFAADDELRRDAIARDFAVDWLKANPDKWFYLVRTRFVRFWEPWLHREPMRLLERGVEVYGAVLLVLMVGALPGVTLRFWRADRPALIIHAMLVGNTIMAMIFHGQPRYRFIIESLQILLASAGIVGLRDHVRFSGGWRSALAGLRPSLQRHRHAIVGVLLVSLGYAVVARFDEQHIEAYREQVCEERLREIRQALAAYRREEGRMAVSLGALVPRYLPNMDSLHCPKHSLRWNDYVSLSATDALHGAVAISYSLNPVPGEAGGVRVEETEARHHGMKKGISYP